MPKSKLVETVKEPEICILRMGKHNNVVQCKESMYNLATELGEVGTYFHTNVAYRYPIPTKGNTTPTTSSPY
jgi:hypothetical protein